VTQSSSIKQIPVSLVLELLEVAYPEELREEGETTHLFLLPVLETGGLKIGTRLGNNTTAPQLKLLIR